MESLKDGSNEDVSLLPSHTSFKSLAANKNISVDTKAPVITMTTGGFYDHLMLVDDEQSTTMKYFVQSSSACANSPVGNAQSYVEGSTLTLLDSYEGKYLCFWSEDAAG